MKHQRYILDFDGVICHSAVEIAYVAWKCARKLWPAQFPWEEITDAATRHFLDVRPYLEYGAESILMLKLLADGWQPERFAAEFCGHSDELIAAAGLDKVALVAAFGACRDELISRSKDFWLQLNHCYHQSISAIQRIRREHVDLLILTTKQERFVKLILDKVGIDLPDAAIVGMDAGRRKVDVVAEISAEHPGEVCFVEDRLEALKAVLQDGRSAGKVQLYLAEWGYASPSQLREAATIPEIVGISSLEEAL